MRAGSRRCQTAETTKDYATKWVSPGLIEVDDHIGSNRGVVSGTVSSTYQDVDGFTFALGDKTPDVDLLE